MWLNVFFFLRGAYRLLVRCVLAVIDCCMLIGAKCWLFHVRCLFLFLVGGPLVVAYFCVLCIVCYVWCVVCSVMRCVLCVVCCVLLVACSLMCAVMRVMCCLCVVCCANNKFMCCDVLYLVFMVCCCCAVCTLLLVVCGLWILVRCLMLAVCSALFVAFS